jgi:hypothetical protein
MTSTHTRELDHRVTDGIDVRLVWHAHDDSLHVEVADARTGDAFTVTVAERHRALSVFHHPYAYAA